MGTVYLDHQNTGNINYTNVKYLAGILMPLEKVFMHYLLWPVSPAFSVGSLPHPFLKDRMSHLVVVAED